MGPIPSPLARLQGRMRFQALILADDWQKVDTTVDGSYLKFTAPAGTTGLAAFRLPESKVPLIAACVGGAAALILVLALIHKKRKAKKAADDKARKAREAAAKKKAEEEKKKREQQ